MMSYPGARPMMMGTQPMMGTQSMMAGPMLGQKTMGPMGPVLIQPGMNKQQVYMRNVQQPGWQQYSTVERMKQVAKMYWYKAQQMFYLCTWANFQRKLNEGDQTQRYFKKGFLACWGVFFLIA